MNKKTSKQVPDKKVTNKHLDQTTKVIDNRKKGEMNKEELAKKVHALMGNIDSDEPPIEFTNEDLIYTGIIDNPAKDATPKKPVTKTTVAKPKSTSKAAHLNTTKSTIARNAAKVSEKASQPTRRKAATTPTTKASAKASSAAKLAKNNVSLTSGTPTSKTRAVPKKIATATKKPLVKSSQIVKAITLQDKKLTSKRKKATVRQPLAQYTAKKAALALANDTIERSAHESKAVPRSYRRSNFLIGLLALLCGLLAYGFLGQAPIAKETPVYQESIFGWHSHPKATAPLNSAINTFNSKAWAVIKLKRDGKNTTSAVKAREKAYQELLQALKKYDSTGEIAKDLRNRQAKIKKTLT